MISLFYILAATVLTSLVSLVGAVTLVLKEKILKKITLPLVALSTGALLGGAFLHLMPEALESMKNAQTVMFWVIGGFLAFLVLEQFIHWHHCHRMPTEHRHPVTYLILFSDGLHNFIDGLAVGAAFLIDVRLGIATTLAMIAHEIPQELGDFGILLHGGWSKTHALLFNLFSGLTMVVGGVLVWALARDINMSFLLPFAAGNFIYIAASDLIPEFKGCHELGKNFLHLGIIILGVFLMYALLFLEV